MGKVRCSEFVTHVRRLESNMMVVSRYGELKFSGQHAYSYEMIVGKVWPQFKIIVWNEEASARSKTTNVHRLAVTNAAFDLKDYLFLPARNKDMEENPFTLVDQRWNGGNELPREQALDILDMFTWLRANKNRDALMKEYVSLPTQFERDSMRGVLELAHEATRG